MSKKSKKLKQQGWKNIIELWQNIGAPARPSNKDLIIYNREVQKIKVKSPKVLILGATPELRDICYQNKCISTVVDINLNSLIEMKKLMKYPNEEEILIRCNWLNLSLKEHYFDAVLADASQNSLEFKKYPKFMEIITKSIKTKGVFVNRVMLKNKEWRMEKLKNIYNELERQKEKINFQNLRFRLQFATYNKKQQKIYANKYFQKCFPLLKQLNQINLLSIKELKNFQNTYQNNTMVWTWPRQYWWENLLSKYFTNIKIEVTGDNIWSKNFPFYICSN